MLTNDKYKPNDENGIEMMKKKNSLSLSVLKSCYIHNQCIKYTYIETTGLMDSRQIGFEY